MKRLKRFGSGSNRLDIWEHRGCLWLDAPMWSQFTVERAEELAHYLLTLCAELRQGKELEAADGRDDKD